MNRLLSKTGVFFLLCLILNCASVVHAQETDRYWMYVATSDANDSIGGTAVYEWNAQKGELKFIKKSNRPKHSRYLTVNTPKHKVYALYNGVLSTYTVLDNGLLGFVDSFKYGKEKGGFISLDNSQSFLLGSLYASGGVMTFQLDEKGAVDSITSQVKHKGKGPHAKRQKSAHPHMAIQPKGSNLVFVPDLGNDKVFTYHLKARGSLEPSIIPFLKLPEGTGPRYVAFHPAELIVYILTELSAEIYAYHYDPEKGITRFINKQRILPETFNGFNTSADIAVTDNGKFLYASNRGHNSIAICTIDKATGGIAFRETLSSGGDTPREFTIDPSGNYLLVANQKSNNVCVFKIDQKTGNLTLRQNMPTGSSPQGFGFFGRP